MMRRIARLRVPLGFLCAAAAFVLARPTLASFAAGAAIACAGEALRLWAAGHLEKGREITRSGPYRYFRHPLYAGSTLLGAGFAVASRSVWAGGITIAYLAVTLTAAMRTEEATLDARFAGEYSAYREGRAAPVDRPFSWARVGRNREWRALLGLAAVLSFLVWRAGR